MTEAEDFEKYHPVKPLFVYKTRRKYYEIKFIKEPPFLWVSSSPVSSQIMREKSTAWILPIHFNGNPVDVVDCFSCNHPFIRHHPHQQYCPKCQRLRFKKTRYCQNPECKKPLPVHKHGKAKYCNGACRTAACRIRKKGLSG
ncbi:MAG TPA: hypothetical protein PLO06_04355 [Methanoregulaceae archaeon]|nr:hypothetical protein [Methanoregulaceae archaeon]HPD75546.1 hypothetical protein [Methanoregulaceae archaeon]